MKLRRRAFQRYQKLGVAYEAAREPAYIVLKRAKGCDEMGATPMRFKVGNDVRVRMAPLNRYPTKLHSKWSMLYQIVAANGVLSLVEDPEMRESLTAHLDLSPYQAAAIEQGWCLRPEAASAGQPGEATLARLFQYAPGIYPLMAQASFEPGKAELEKMRAAQPRPATNLNKPKVAALGSSGSMEVMAGGAGNASVGNTSLRQLTRGVGSPLAILISLQGFSRVPTQSLLNQATPIPLPSLHTTLANLKIQTTLVATVSTLSLQSLLSLENRPTLQNPLPIQKPVPSDRSPTRNLFQGLDVSSDTLTTSS